MLCFPIICSWWQKCQILLVLAGLCWIKAKCFVSFDHPFNDISVQLKAQRFTDYNERDVLPVWEDETFWENTKQKNNEDKNSTNAKALSSQWQTNLPAWSVIKVLIISGDTQDNYFTRVREPLYCDFLESF